MTENETLGMLKAKLTCMELELLFCIGKGCDRNCENCEYNYTQGNMGEQKEALAVAIKALEEIRQYRAIGTVEEFKELKEYKGKMGMQYLDDMDNPLEPLKLSSALQSEILKYNYRKEHKPQDINILDYTVMCALKHCLEEQINSN